MKRGNQESAALARVNRFSGQIQPGWQPEVDVQIWCLYGSDPEPDLTLNADEQVRANRYLIPEAGRQFRRGRKLLRAILAAYLGRNPQELAFAFSADGKPSLVDSEGFHFNLTHTEGMVQLAVSRRPVGIDCERFRPLETATGLVGRFFAAEENRIYELLPADFQPYGFLRAWACKEALLKGVGCGARGLEQCVVEMDPRKPSRVLQLAGPAAELGELWGLATWQPTEELVSAVAVCGVPSVRLELASDCPPLRQK